MIYRSIKFKGKSLPTKFSESRWVEGSFIKVYNHTPSPMATREEMIQYEAMTQEEKEKYDDSFYDYYILVPVPGDWCLPGSIQEVKVDRNTISQFTGVKTEKTNEELWEGDIVEYHDGDVCIIEYDFNSFSCKVLDETKPYGWKEFVPYYFKKIGNKWDNPELLEKYTKKKEGE